MSTRLYDLDGHCRVFTAAVLACVPEGEGFAVELSQTAFFPMGGGQAGDQGTLGEVRVLDTLEREGRVLHMCDGPLPVGATVEGALGWPLRFARMQVHSGEHIVSGIAHSLWGCENVGFHMTEDGAVLDFDRELTDGELIELERRANETIWQNLPFHIWYPTAEELKGLSFRQKKELQGPVRIVEIEGIDRCACCAPHVSFTGEIGLIRIVDAMRHRGGVRLTMLAGRSAYADAADRGADAALLSRLFSAPRQKLPEAAEKLLAHMDEMKAAMAELERRNTALLLRSAGESRGDLVFFLPGGESAAALRELAEGGAERCDGICAVFSAVPAGGWKYVLASRTRDLKSESRALNAALRGRGGGAPGMIQGSCAASKEEIEGVFHGKSIGGER